MKLTEIIKDYSLEVKGNIENVEVADVTCDSRKVEKNTMFFCIKGYKTDGHDYAPMAVEKGASVLVVTEFLDLDVPQIKVADDREAMAVLSSNFFGRPQDKLRMVGVTGTNGKTTTTYLCAAVAKSAGLKVGILGTICNYIGDTEYPSSNTTPESVELFRLLAKMVEEGIDIVFMEVSSHSLYLKRVYGIEFEVGAFTNLTQDHLDFHITEENYVEAKSILFENSRTSIINGDDKWADFLCKKAKDKFVTYGLKDTNDFYASNIEGHSWGNEFTLNYEDKALDIVFHVPGTFSVYNAVLAGTMMRQLGFSEEQIYTGLFETQGVNGRCQVLNKEPFTIILDYAHTPDGLENILKTFKGLGRLVAVFGCGGNRDATKRPIMGRIGGEYADFVVVTSDNPRFEEPMDIIAQVEEGVKQTDCPYVVIEDRRNAIKYAIDNAKQGDIIVLAGKGHETYQDIKGVKHDFDEKVIVKEILNVK